MDNLDNVDYTKYRYTNNSDNTWYKGYSDKCR